jgi:hypothetical protein
MASEEMQVLGNLQPGDKCWNKLRWNEILDLVLTSQDEVAIRRAAEFAICHQVAHADQVVEAWKQIAWCLEAEGLPKVGLELLHVANEVVRALARKMAGPGRLGRARSCSCDRGFEAYSELSTHMRVRHPGSMRE